MSDCSKNGFRSYDCLVNHISSHLQDEGVKPAHFVRQCSNNMSHPWVIVRCTASAVLKRHTMSRMKMYKAVNTHFCAIKNSHRINQADHVKRCVCLRYVMLDCSEISIPPHSSLYHVRAWCLYFTFANNCKRFYGQQIQM